MNGIKVGILSVVMLLSVIAAPPAVTAAQSLNESPDDDGVGDRIGRRRAAGIAVALLGMAAMSAGDLLAGAAVRGDRPLYGNALAVLGAVMAAIYVLVGRSLRQRLALVPYVLVVYAACTLTLLVVALGRGLPLSGYGTREWAIFLALAVGPGLFGHTVVNWALEHVESSVVSVSLLGEPVGATVLALVLLAEVPGPTTLAGALFVLAGIYLTSRTEIGRASCRERV